MYHETELKTIDQSDSDSDNSSSFSYPYSRFTLAGKRKSRLGTRSRFPQQTVNNEEQKPKDGVGSEKKDTPQTPSWPRANSQPSALPVTPGEGLFRHTQPSVNDSAIDVYSQSNFVNSLKRESIQTSNRKKNLALDSTPFKTQVLKESNSSFKTHGQLNFHLETKEENKKIIPVGERKFENVKNKENVFDPLWNQCKRICDAGVSQTSTEISEQSHGGFGCNFVRPHQQSNPGVFLAPCTKPLQQQKEEDDVSNTPLDLSCGESLSRKNLFKLCSSSGSELTADSSSIPIDCVNKSVDRAKDHVDHTDIRETQISPDLLSSILPEFMVPTKKVQAKDSPISENVNEMPSVSGFVNNSYIGSGIVTPAIINEPDNLICCLPKLKVTDSQLSTSTDALHKLSEIKAETLFKIPSSEIKNNPNVMSNNCQVPDLSPKKSGLHLENAANPPGIAHNKLVANVDLMNAKLLNKNDEIGSSLDISISPRTNVSETFSTFEVEIKDEKDLLDKLMEKQAYSKLFSQQDTNKKEVSEALKSETGNPNQPSASSFKPARGIVLASPKLKVNQISSESVFKHSLDDDKDDLILPSFSSLSLGENPVRKNEHIFKEHEDHRMHVRSTNKVFEKSSHLPQLKPSVILQNKSVAPTPSVQQVNIFTNQPPNSLKESVESRPSADIKLHSLKVQQLPQQNTFLVPQPPTSRRPLNGSVPLIKPQEVGRRPNFVPTPRFQNNFNMSGPRGNASCANSELFVNGKTYSILSMLGRGGSSEVYQVLDPASSKLLAVKCVDLSMVDRTIADGYLNEIDLLSKLQGCSSVIRMFDYEYIQDLKMLYVVMEKGDTDLSQLIRDINKTKKISMSMIIYYWTEMLTAVSDIHEQGIIHSDLKPANFLLVSGRLKLIDFGIASSQGDMTSVVKEVTTGTWNYMSPEALRNTSATGKGFKITYKSDVWSLGCILYNLVYGKTPFSHINNTWAKLQAITDPSHRVEFPEAGAPSVLMSALRQCLRREPASRPTVTQLLVMPYHNPTDVVSVGRRVEDILGTTCPQAWDLIKHLFAEREAQAK